MASTGKQSWFARHCKPAPAWRFDPACPCDACFRKQTYQSAPFAPACPCGICFRKQTCQSAQSQPSDWPYSHPTVNNNGLSPPSSETTSLSGTDDAASASSRRLM